MKTQNSKRKMKKSNAKMKNISSSMNQETRRHGYLPPRDDSVESPAGKFLVLLTGAVHSLGFSRRSSKILNESCGCSNHSHPHAPAALQRPPRSLGSLRLKLVTFVFSFCLLSLTFYVHQVYSA